MISVFARPYDRGAGGLALRAGPDGHFDFVIDPRPKKWFVLKNTATDETVLAQGDAPPLGGASKKRFIRVSRAPT